MKTLKVIVFDIKGTFAHFRKFYTNSSSTTYDMIPRTTLMGIIAAILGYERDSYYEKLSSDNMCVTAKKTTETYKIMQTMNYIRATSMTELIKQNQHTQVPFQVLTGKHGVGYRIYVSINNDEIMNELAHRLKNSQYGYNITLGTANFISSVNYVGTYRAENIILDEKLKLEVPVNIKYVESIDVTGELIKEKMVRDFNEKREATEICDYIYSPKSEVKIKCPIYSLDKLEEFLVFM